MTEVEEPSLRETKRRATRAAIEEHATGMVAEHGAENVTVEDICAAAGISKRTFFNYVDSKETAILGDPPRPPSETERAEFLNREHEDLLTAVITLSAEVTLAGQLVDSPQRSEILRRRKEIRHKHPELILQRSARFHEIHRVLRTLMVEYFGKYPQALRADSTAEQEASTYVALAGTTLQLGYMSWLHGTDNSPAALQRSWQQALTDIATLIEGRRS